VLSRGKEPIEGSWIVRAEVVQHYPDAERIRVVVVGNRLHAVDPLAGTASLGHVDVTPASERFGRQVEHSFAVAFVMVSVRATAPGRAGSGSRTWLRSALLDSSKQMTGRLWSNGS